MTALLGRLVDRMNKPADNKLFLGTRRYSSWSMRGWLAVRLAGLEVEDVVIPLAGGSTKALAGLTPAGLVPALQHDGRVVWDSLAICEYCAEFTPSLWPKDAGERAAARSISAEVHAGFRDLRLEMPMSLFRQAPGTPVSAAAQADIARIDELWQQCLISAGPFLFGSTMTIADVMYAPVVARFLTYTPALSEPAQGYCSHVRAAPQVADWYNLAAAEPMAWRIAKYE